MHHTDMEVIRKHFEIIGSTNTWAKEHAETFERGKITLITAREQTAGRGRFKPRRWESPPGLNIYATFCFFLERIRQDIANLPQVLAMSAAKALEQMNFKPKLKWPNDILLGDRKMGGILAETTTVSDQLCVVLGIGLNINMPQEILVKIDRPATSLYAETGHLYDVEEVLQALQRTFVVDLTKFIKEGFSPFLQEYRRRLGENEKQLIRFNDNKIIWEGYYLSVNKDGSLNLLLKDGEVKTFLVGEILWPDTLPKSGG